MKTIIRTMMMPIIRMRGLAVMTALLSMIFPITAAAGGDEGVKRPHFTSRTRFLKKDVSMSALHPVSEGIFALQEYNRKYGYGAYFGFWTIDGKCLFDARYEQMGGVPRFDNGAAVVKGLRNDKGFQPVMILYSDGSARELPESYKEVSQFHDGVAVVRPGGMGARQTSHFCIDTRGERVFTSLGPGDVMEVGYLRDGLRRVKIRTEPERFRYVTRWGFIDARGNWKIQPRLKDAREFANGYALVVDETDRMKFIDTAGNTVYEFAGTASDLNYAKDLSDISDGRFMRGNAFFDLKGNELKRYHLASGFTDGYAFVQDDMNSPLYSIDTGFRRVRTLYGVDVNSGRVLLGADNPKFGDCRLGTIDRRNVVTPDGMMRIVGQKWPSEIEDFYPDAYAKCSSTFRNRATGKEHEYVGYINRNGEYEVVFCKDAEGGGPFDPVIPEDPPRVGDTLITWLPPVDTVSRGPRDVARVKYQVKVMASPAEGGKVAGGGMYSYGDTVTVGARANDGWRISDIACDNRYARTSEINRFVVRGDMEITVYFLKDDEATPVRDGIYSGEFSFRPNGERSKQEYTIPLYLETSATSALETPYGPDTRGFLAVMLDPDKKIVDTSVDPETGRERGTFSMNVFYVPMQVAGQVEDNGRKYLLLNGGDVKVNNLRMLNSGDKAADVSAMETVMVNLMLMFDAPSGEIKGGSYRVEMKDIDERSGAFTFGKMERISNRKGWIPAGSADFENVERGFFVTQVDRGLPANYFEGIRMTPSARRDDVLWTPTPGYFENDLGILESFASELGKNFREFQSEYDIIKGLDMRQVNEAFDRLMKGK